MKKILLLFALGIMAAGVYAQAPSKNDPKTKDYVVMKEGKMLLVKNGKTTAMDKEMTLSDGTRVMSDGKVMMKDGSTKLLEEGETLTLDGKPGKTKKKDGA